MKIGGDRKAGKDCCEKTAVFLPLPFLEPHGLAPCKGFLYTEGKAAVQRAQKPQGQQAPRRLRAGRQALRTRRAAQVPAETKRED